MTTEIINPVSTANLENTPPPATRLNFSGRAGEIGKIVFLNKILSVLTLSIYRFWATTRIRRYLWSRFSIDGQPFEYTGTGFELFKGFLIAIVIFLAGFVPLSVLGVLSGSKLIQVLVPLGQVLVILVLAVLAQFYAHRYRASRTQLRGIRFMNVGRAARYLLLFLREAVLLVLTLGLIGPRIYFIPRNYLFGTTVYGATAVTSTGTARDSRLPWYLMVVAMLAFGAISISILVYMAGTSGTNDNGDINILPEDMTRTLAGIQAIPYLVLSAFMVWFSVAAQRDFARGLGLDGHSLRFASSLSTATVIGRGLVAGLAAYGAVLIAGIAVFAVISGDMITELGALFGSRGEEESADIGGLVLLLIQLLPLALALMLLIAPIPATLWAMLFTIPVYRNFCQTLTVTGTVDWAAVEQGLAQAPGRGEGLVDILDIAG